MRRQHIGSLIGAAFGLAYILINTGEFPTVVVLALRVLGIAAFVSVLLTLRRAPKAHGGRAAPRPGFGVGYWFVVAAEVAAGAAGLIALNGPFDAPEAGVAWVSFVVGVHFFGLAALWREPFFWWIGLAITVCGVVGLLVVALSDSPSKAVIAAVSGVVPGAILLAAAWIGVRRS